MVELKCPDCEHVTDVPVCVGLNCERRFEFECDGCGIWLPGLIWFDGNEPNVEIDHGVLEELRTSKDGLFSRILG